jgi:hypothetical protein
MVLEPEQDVVRHRLKSKLSMLLESGSSLTVHFFVGDDFLTIVSKDSVLKIKMRLEGTADVRKLVETPDYLQRTTQYRVMCALGFTPASDNGMVYRQFLDGKWVTVVFFYSKICEIKVAGSVVDRYSLKMEGIGGYDCSAENL